MIMEHLIPLFRLYNSAAAARLLTASPAERDKYMAQGWVSEGIIAHVLPSTLAQDHPLYGKLVALQRLWRAKPLAYLHTTAEQEVKFAQANKWQLDGALALVFSPAAPPLPEAVPLFRLRHRRTGQRLFTTDPHERDNVRSLGFVYEGVAAYVYGPTPNAVAIEAGLSLGGQVDAAYSRAVLADRPIGYWKLDETTGNVARDSSGNNRHGAIRGNVKWDQQGAGPGQRAAAFDGKTGLIEIPGSWGGYKAISVEAWFYVNEATAAPQTVFGCPAQRHAFIQLGKGGTGAFSNAGIFSFPLMQTPAKVWRHVVLVVKHGSAQLFVDGSLQRYGAQAVSAITTTDKLYIGAGLAGKRFFSGLISDVALYDIDLSPERIIEHFRAANRPVVSADSEDEGQNDYAERYSQAVLADKPIGYWRLDEDSGTVAHDSSGNSRHGTVRGQVLWAQGGPAPDWPALSFDGKTGQIEVPGTWGGTKELTVEAWFQISKATGGFQTVVGALTPSFAFIQPHAAGGTGAFSSKGMHQFTVPQTPTGVWRHVALVVRDGRSQVFLDGHLTSQAAQNVDAIRTTDKLCIGWGLGKGRFLNGLISNVAVYDRALPAERVAAHVNATSDVSGQPVDCLVVLPTDEFMKERVHALCKGSAAAMSEAEFRCSLDLRMGSLGPRVPLYRAWKEGVDHLYTTDLDEVQDVVANKGYQDEGICGYVAAIQLPGSVPLYRLYGPLSGNHFYTVSAAERDNALANGYIAQGVACYVMARPCCCSLPLYRALNNGKGRLTTDRKTFIETPRYKFTISRAPALGTYFGEIWITDKQTKTHSRVHGDPHLYTGDGDRLEFQESLTLDLEDNTKVILRSTPKDAKGIAAVDGVAVLTYPEAVTATRLSYTTAPPLISPVLKNAREVERTWAQGTVLRAEGTADDFVLAATGQKLAGGDPKAWNGSR